MPRSAIKLPPDWVKLNFEYADDYRIGAFTANNFPAMIQIGKTRVLVHKWVYEYLNGKAPAMPLPKGLTRKPYAEIRGLIAEYLLHPSSRNI